MKGEQLIKKIESLQAQDMDFRNELSADQQQSIKG
jgi:hypothetical protein